MLTGREAVEGQQLLAGLFQTGGYRRRNLAPLGQEAFPCPPPRRTIRGVDGSVVLFADRFLDMLGDLGQQVAQLVDDTTLMRNTRRDPFQRAA